jgi:hypothetical protein
MLTILVVAQICMASQPRVVDVALNDENLLVGRLVNGAGQGQNEAVVSIWSAHELIHQTVTDSQGQFVLHVARGGVYRVSDGQASVAIRAWTSRAAPPSANDAILLVSRGNVSRANLMPLSLDGAVFFAACAGVVYLAVDNDDSS